MNRLSHHLLGFFYGFAGLSFVYVFLMAFFWNREDPLALVLGFSLFFAACLFLRRLTLPEGRDLFAFLDSRRTRVILVLCLLGLFALLQIYFGSRLMIDSTKEPWDIWVVRQTAAWVAEHPFSPRVENIEYFQRCDNNRFILTVLTLWFMLCRRIFGALDYEVFGLALSVLSVTASMGLTYLAAKNFFGVRSAFFSLCAWFFFLPFYSYAPIYYTDTLCLPYITLSAWLLSRFYLSRKPVFAALAGISMGLGGSMKGTLYVFIIAALIWLIFLDGLTLLRRMVSIGLCVLFLLGSVAGFGAFYEHSGLFGEHPTDKNGMAMPFTHYLMMAQSPNGPFDPADVAFTHSIQGGYALRTKVCWDIFRGRLLSRGLVTDLLFTNKKVVAVWGEGTYQMDQYPRDYAYHPDSVWFRLFNRNDPDAKPVVLFCNIFHFTLLASLLGSLWQRLVRRRYTADGLFLMQLALFGMFLFELFWEWRSRYLIGYVPFLIAMLPQGLAAWLDLACMAKQRFGKKSRGGLTEN